MDGQRYPPATMRSSLSGLNRELQKAKAPSSLLDKSDRRLRELHLTLTYSASVITAEDENLFWETGSLGHSSPTEHCLFYVGLHFILRGIQEQYDLVPKQFERTPQTLVCIRLIRITIILSRTINIVSRMVKLEIRKYVRMHNQARLDVL